MDVTYMLFVDYTQKRVGLRSNKLMWGIYTRIQRKPTFTSAWLPTCLQLISNSTGPNIWT